MMMVEEDLVPQLSTSDSPVQEDWFNNLNQILDLPQLFSFKDMPSSSPADNNLGDQAQQGPPILLDIESLLKSVPAEAQHGAPGPIRNNKLASQHTTSLKEIKEQLKPKEITAVTIARDDLLKFSSEDLEAYVKAVTATRALTALELKEIKRQRRLIKNRESAQQSRKRKKDRVGDLEIQCAELEGIHSVQKEKLDELQAENVILKAEVTQLVNVVKDSPALSSLLYQVSSLMVMYTLARAINTQNIQNTLVPSIIQQQIQQLPSPRAIC